MAPNICRLLAALLTQALITIGIGMAFGAPAAGAHMGASGHTHFWYPSSTGRAIAEEAILLVTILLTSSAAYGAHPSFPCALILLLSNCQISASYTFIHT